MIQFSSSKMKNILGIILFVPLLVASCVYAQQPETMGKEISLPPPQLKGKISLEAAINQRRSQRRYRSRELSLEQISQLLWSAQGITDERKGFRAAPSAGALYPMEIYLLSKDGCFHYIPQGHKLVQVLQDDLRKKLSAACLGQGYIGQAAVDIVIAAVYERITSHYGSRGIRYTDIEVGHIAQNVHLQAVALGLDSVPVGAFDDQAVTELLNLPDEQRPLYIIPVGYAR